MRTHRKVVLFAAVAAVGLGGSKARATDRDWNGFGTTQNWSNANNWLGLTSPGSGDGAFFGDITSVGAFSVVNTDRTVANFVIDGPSGTQGDFTFAGNSTTLTVSNIFQMDQPNPVQDNATISSGLTVSAAGVLLEKDSHLTISGGGTVVTPDLEMQPQTSQETLVIGHAGTLHLTGGTYDVAAGTLELDSGGALNIDSGVPLNLSGSGSTLALNTNWAVPAGVTVNATSGAHIAASGAFDVATGNTGTLVVDGSSVSAGGLGASQWGDGAGTATVTFQNSGVGTYNSGLRIDNNLGGAAIVKINTGAQLTVASGLYVGGGSLNSANITLNSATLAIASGTQSFADFQNKSTLNLQSGTLQLGANATFETGSTLNWSGGTISAIGQTLGINGGVASLTFGGIQMNGATLSVTNGGHLDSNSYLFLGTLFSLGSGGTLNVSDPGSHVAFSASASAIGFGTGDFATATFANFAVGTFSTGLVIGDFGAATLNVNSNAVLNVATYFSSGENAFIGSAATINIAGGTLNSTGTTSFLSGSRVNLSSGGLVLGDNATFSSGSNFNWTGGSLSIASGKTLTFDGSTGTIATGSGLSNGATIHVTDGAHVTNSQYLDVGNTDDGGANGTLLIDGAGSSYTTTSTLGNYTDFGFFIGDFGTLTISNNGAGTFTQLRLATNGGKALVTLSSGSLNIGTYLQAGSAVASATATINISGGILNSMGTALFQNGALVNLSSGTASFAGNATFSSGSTLNWSGGSLLLSTGKTLEIDGVGTLSPNQVYKNGSTLSIGAGALVNASQFVIGSFNSSPGTGTLLVSGANARLISTPSFGQSIISSGGTLIVSNGGVATFTAGSIFASSGGLDDGNGGAFIQAGPTGGTINGAILTLKSGSATTHMNVIGGTVNFTGAATFSGSTVVNYQSGSINIGSTLTTNNTSATTVATGAVLRTHGLSMNDTSTMNLNGGFIDDYSGGTPISTIRGYILSGRTGLGGLWTGAGINSSTAAAGTITFAVGYADASAIGSPATFMGQSIDNTSVLARLTYNGDANLDGKVNALDFNALATNFGKTPGSDVWTQGDFNYDGSVSTSDFTAMAGNFNATPLSAPLLGSLVPEPLGVARIGALAILSRRRRRWSVGVR